MRTYNKTKRDKHPERAPSSFLGHVETKTPKAVLFQAHDWSEPEWLPSSQVTIIEHSAETEVHIAAWLVDKNGWDEMGEVSDVVDNETAPFDDDEIPF
jgi:hypothetical protein